MNRESGRARSGPRWRVLARRGDRRRRARTAEGPDPVGANAVDVIAAAVEVSAAATTTEATLSRHGIVLQSIVQGQPLDEVMMLVAELIAAEIPGCRPAVVGLDPDGGAVSVAAAPGLPQRVWPAIERQAIRTTLSAPKAGRGGLPWPVFSIRAEQERRVVVTASVVDDPSWDEWRESATELGLVSSWSMAFLGTANSVLGALVLYFPTLVHPNRAGLQSLGDAGQLAAAAVQHVAHRQQLREQVRTESLTGLPDRVVLLERLRLAQKRAVATGDYYAIVQLAIDGLAQLIETLGPAAGDEVLRLAAQRLVRVAGTSATVAHVWGVEFAVLLEDLESPAAGDKIAAGLGAACREPFDVEGLAVSVGATIGLVTYGPNTAGPNTYGPNPAGPNPARPNPAGSNTAGGVRPIDAIVEGLGGRSGVEVHEPDPVMLGPELRHGLEANELSMVYQPIVELVGNRVTRYEALLRWRNPRRGPVPPATFVHVAEQTGLVADLGRYALREALAELARLRRVEPELGISVNVSVRQLADLRLPLLLADLLDEHQLPRGSVTLEVTEGVLLRGGAAGWRVLAGLREIGARIALDDFGTGFSQLSYLRQFWFDEIKIDRSYVTAMMRDVAARAVIVGVIAVAGYAGSEVVAEGVERAEERAMLLELGCTYGQGYLFGAPGPVVAT